MTSHQVGGSIHDISAIVGAVSGLGSLASMVAVGTVSSALKLLGWEHLFTVGAVLALGSGMLHLVPFVLEHRCDVVVEAGNSRGPHSPRRLRRNSFTAEDAVPLKPKTD